MPEPAVKPENVVLVKFRRLFEQFLDFVKRYDFLGIARTYQVSVLGPGKVLYDFTRCLYERAKGGKCDIRPHVANVLKLPLASVLFGTAVYAIPVLGLDISLAALAFAGIKAVQYLYSPFWLWASRNLDNEDPRMAQRANLMLAAIPSQFRDMIAIDKPTREWATKQGNQMHENQLFLNSLVRQMTRPDRGTATGHRLNEAHQTTRARHGFQVGSPEEILAPYAEPVFEPDEVGKMSGELKDAGRSPDLGVGHSQGKNYVAGKGYTPEVQEKPQKSAMDVARSVRELRDLESQIKQMMQRRMELRRNLRMTG